MNEADLLDALLRGSFHTFVKRVFREIAAGETYEDSWAVEAMCYALSEAGSGRRRRQIVAVPPRSLKSIIASIALPAWILGHDPTAKIICVSYSGVLADQFSAACRQVMKSDWYRTVFPNTVISPLKDSEGYFRTTAGGFRDSTSVGGTLTGKGGSLVIIDDPAKPDEAMSDVQRRTINEWYGRTLISRLNNKATDTIVLVMQRLHVDDLVAHVTEREEWKMLVLPAIAEAEERIQLSANRWHTRAAEEVLRPKSEPIEVLMEMKAQMGTQAFSAQYQQRPIPLEGELVKRAWFQTYDTVLQPPYSAIVQSWDMATKTTAGADYSACITAAKVKGDLFILDVYRERLGFPGLRDRVIRHAAFWNPQFLLIEDTGAGSSLIQLLRHERIEGIALPTPFKPEGDKLTRLATASPMIEQGRVFLPRSASWLGDFLAELLAFPAVKHDDQVDAFSQLLTWIGNKERNPHVIQQKGMFEGERKPARRFDAF